MSYDIPDEIKYKEKIVFGLSFRQFAYACGFGLFALLAYNLPIPGDAKLVLPSIIVMTGLGFILLNLSDSVMDHYHFYANIQHAKHDEVQTQRLIGVKIIQNNAAYLSNGQLLAILQIQPINFSLLDEGQRTAVILAYREFLNHLTTPVQILVKTAKPDLTAYFDAAQKRLENAPKKLVSLFRDFRKYEEDFLEKNNVRERTFYLVVSHQPVKTLASRLLSDRADDVQLLDQKTKIIQDKLAACGLKSRRLENDEIARLYSEYSSQEQETTEEETTNGQEKNHKAQVKGKPKGKAVKGRKK